jgi:hypothetical protein
MMLSVLQCLAATAHDFAMASGDVMGVFGSEAWRTCRRSRSTSSRRRYSSLQTLLGMRQCSVQSLGVRVEGVKLGVLVSNCSRPWCNPITGLARRTVGVLELVFWLHTHIFFGTLGSGVVQNNVML